MCCKKKYDKVVFILKNLIFMHFSHALKWIPASWTISAPSGHGQFLWHFRFADYVHSDWDAGGSDYEWVRVDRRRGRRWQYFDRRELQMHGKLYKICDKTLQKCYLIDLYLSTLYEDHNIIGGSLVAYQKGYVADRCPRRQFYVFYISTFSKFC